MLPNQQILGERSHQGILQGGELIPRRRRVHTLCVGWQAGTDFKILAGRLIRIRFVFRNAMLKGVRFLSSPKHFASAPISAVGFDHENLEAGAQMAQNEAP